MLTVKLKSILLLTVIIFSYSNAVSVPYYPPDTKYVPVPYPQVLRPGYLQPMKDPIFKTKIIRITDQAAFGQSNVRHHYSKDQPWNCDQTKIMIGSTILDAKTYAVIKMLNLPNEPKWSYKDPNKIFGISGNSFVSVNVTTGSSTTLHTFSGYSQLYMGPWEGNISTDDGTVAFVSSTSGGDVIIYDITNDKVLATKSLSSLGHTVLDWVSVSQSGNYVVILGNGVKSYDRSLNYISAVSSGGHGDLGYDAWGNEVFVQVGVYMYQLNNGKETLIANGGYGGHISCRNYKRPGWVYITYQSQPEVLAAKLDGSKTVERFTYHNSSYSTYPAEAQGVASPDGTKMIFASDWYGTAPEINSYVVEMTGPYFLTQSTAGAVTGEYFGLKLSYVTPLEQTATLAYLKKPSWISTNNDSIYGKAPFTEQMDSLVVVVKATTESDTLRLGLFTANYYPFEAENMELVSPMQIGNDVNASAGSYIYTPAGTALTIFPKAEAICTVNVANADSYYVWLRLYAPDSKNCGIFSGFNSKYDLHATQPNDTGVYEWVRGEKGYYLSAGNNMLNIGHKDQLARVDRIVVTISPAYFLPPSILAYTSSTIIPKIDLDRQTILNNSISFIENGVVLNLQEKGNYSIKLISMDGRTVWSSYLPDLTAGMNVFQLNNASKKIAGNAFIAVVKKRNNELIKKISIVK